MQYKDESRGKIQNRVYSTQINDFSNLKFDKITPTDIDGFIDFGNKVLVFIEVKYKSCSIPNGQRLALERLCDATHKGGIKSVVLIGRHESSGDIDVGGLLVAEYRYKQKWVIMNKGLTIREAVLKFKKDLFA